MHATFKVGETHEIGSGFGFIYKIVSISKNYITYLEPHSLSGTPKKIKAKLRTKADGTQYFITKPGWQVEASPPPSFLMVDGLPYDSMSLSY